MKNILFLFLLLSSTVKAQEKQPFMIAVKTVYLGNISIPVSDTFETRHWFDFVAVKTDEVFAIRKLKREGDKKNKKVNILLKNRQSTEFIYKKTKYRIYYEES